MKNSLFYFIIALSSTIGVVRAQDNNVSHAIVMDALSNAKEVDIRGETATGFFGPFVDVDLTITSLSRIREIRKCIKSGGFHETDILSPEDGKWAVGSDAVLHFVVVKATGIKIKFVLIEGERMRISGCYDSKPRDPNYIFRLAEMLILYQSK